MKTYRAGFIWALVANAVLIAALAFVWLRYRSAGERADVRSQTASESAQQSSSPSPVPSAPSSAETQLVPVQISAQRLQSIGVTIGQVQPKNVEDEIRTTGNVAVDETKLAYVQVRFSGYIQRVFADATYQYVQKGQPLFTIYSPDLVATEREY
ncbi:MAG TPA: efflux RND transporter periplasmic adaptor subunit, partial [Terriglobales bacterium]|nr:efflux RND transporter periplasmic adaptor subunit [Terriglobales bacterium]